MRYTGLNTAVKDCTPDDGAVMLREGMAGAASAQLLKRYRTLVVTGDSGVLTASVWLVPDAHAAPPKLGSFAKACGRNSKLPSTVPNESRICGYWVP